MDGIAVSLTMFLLKGIPEGFLVAWGMHILVGIPIDKKKYLILSLLYVLITYLIRFLPITLGINTVLSLFVMIFSLQMMYHIELSKMPREVIASVIILVFIAVSEILNVLLLIMLYGSEKADALVNTSNQIMQAIYTIPSTIFLTIFVVSGYFISKAINKKKVEKNGEDGKEAGQ